MLLGLCGAAAGCSDGGSGEAGAHRPDKAKDVRHRLWKVDVGQAGATSHPVDWATGETVVRAVGRGTLRGFDARTGHVRWSLKVPGGQDGVCANSRRTNAAGVGVVAYGKDGKYGGRCDEVTAVDTRTGRRLWSRRLPRTLGQYDDPFDPGQALTAGERAVAAASDAHGEVRRFAVRSGKRLRTVHGYRGDRRDKARVVGDRIVLLLRPASDSPSAYGRLAAYDVDSGRRLWQGKGSGPGRPNHVDAVSDHPLTVGLASSPGEGSGLRAYDSHGRPLHTFGESDQFRPVPTADRQGGALVGQFSDGVGFTGQEPVYAFEPRSGKQLWRVARSKLRPVGVAGDRFFGVFQKQGSRHGSRTTTWRLASADMRTGHLRDGGTVPPVNHRRGDGGGSAADVTAGVAVDKQRMYLTQSSGDNAAHLYLTAYELPH